MKIKRVSKTLVPKNIASGWVSLKLPPVCINPKRFTALMKITRFDPLSQITYPAIAPACSWLMSSLIWCSHIFGQGNVEPWVVFVSIRAVLELKERMKSNGLFTRTILFPTDLQLSGIRVKATRFARAVIRKSSSKVFPIATGLTPVRRYCPTLDRVL